MEALAVTPFQAIALMAPQLIVICFNCWQMFQVLQQGLSGIGVRCEFSTSCAILLPM